jgi:hypothetical protein
MTKKSDIDDEYSEILIKDSEGKSPYKISYPERISPIKPYSSN